MSQQERLDALEKHLAQLKTEIHREPAKTQRLRLPSQPKARMARIHHLARAMLLLMREDPTRAELYLKRTAKSTNSEH